MSQKPVYLTRAAALGNGTREAGFQIGYLDDAETLSPAAGVEPVEIDNLKRNLDLFTLEAPAVYTGPDSIIVPLPGEQAQSSGTILGIGQSIPQEVKQPAGPDLGAEALWRATPIAEIPGLTPDHVQLLTSANLLTAGQVFDHGQKNKGLTGIKGLTKPMQHAVTTGLAALLEVPPPAADDDGEDSDQS
jgi:hypothetical protein